ncbi:hypothetical protein ACQ4LE_005399 [Meloidogyne hapla]
MKNNFLLVLFINFIGFYCHPQNGGDEAMKECNKNQVLENVIRMLKNFNFDEAKIKMNSHKLNGQNNKNINTMLDFLQKISVSNVQEAFEKLENVKEAVRQTITKNQKIFKKFENAKPIGREKLMDENYFTGILGKLLKSLGSGTKVDEKTLFSGVSIWKALDLSSKECKTFKKSAKIGTNIKQIFKRSIRSNSSEGDIEMGVNNEVTEIQGADTENLANAEIVNNVEENGNPVNTPTLEKTLIFKIIGDNGFCNCFISILSIIITVYTIIVVLKYH